jgi:hypothetical protein
MAFLSTYAAAGIIFPTDKCEEFSDLLIAHFERYNINDSFVRRTDKSSISGSGPKKGSKQANDATTQEETLEGLVEQHMVALVSLCLLDVQFKGK